MTHLVRTTMSDEDEVRIFVARKIGELQAEFARLIATLNLLTPIQAGKLAGRNRILLYVVIGLNILLMLALALHILWSAGWFGG